jgi:preprotein translocase subunit YajC
LNLAGKTRPVSLSYRDAEQFSEFVHHRRVEIPKEGFEIHYFSKFAWCGELMSELSPGNDENNYPEYRGRGRPGSLDHFRWSLILTILPLWTGGEVFMMISLPSNGINPYEGDNILNTDFFNRMLLLAADAEKAVGDAKDGAGAQSTSNPFGFLPLIVLLMIVFYLMVLRPQKKEQKKRLELLNNLKKNDRVVTIGGIYGVVMNAKRENDEVVIKVDETNDTKIRVIYSAIARVISDEPTDESKSK